MGSRNALAVRGLTVDLAGTRVLAGVDLDVAAGGVLALLGPSGCGKTTLLRTVAGLQAAASGTVTLGGEVLADGPAGVPAERRRVGLVFQDWALFPHLDVAANVAFGLDRAQRRAARRGACPAVDAALAMVGLEGLGARLPATLSGGQQQRVALARALAHRPRALLLDEPFSNLDAGLRATVRAEVAALLRSLHLTAVFVTHDQEEAFLLGDQVAVMLEGRIAQQGTARALYETPASEAVASFVGDANLLPGVASGSAAATAVGSVPLQEPARGRVAVLVRPEDLLVEPGDHGVVTALEYYGHDAVYQLATADGQALRARVLAQPDLRPGDRVAVRYGGPPAHAFPAPADA